METTFKKANHYGRIVILNFIFENKKGLHLKFNGEAYKYFKKWYSNIYESFLLSANKKLDLAVYITKRVHENGRGSIISVSKLQYFGGNAETYDDSCYQKFTTPSHPDGIEVKIPLVLIENITPIFGSVRV